MSYIQFINHASVLISNEEFGVLTDPWYEGNVFNNGWNLIIKNNKSDIDNLLNKVNYIWISHEHPDHFSTNFFLNYKEIILEKEIKILFQKTRDKRVIKFLKAKGFSVIEINNNQNFTVDHNFKIQIQNVDFYDSALIVDIGDKRIINLNDCPFETEKDLKNFSNKFGPADILLSQFGYAAWKGGKDNRQWRRDSAREKLKTLYKQASYLKCKKLIPFASFIYFSNKENCYLNDDNNSPDTVNDYFKDKIDTVFFKPMEIQDLNKLSQARNSLDFWRDKFSNIKELDYAEYSNTYSAEELKIAYDIYQKKLSIKNSFFMIKLLHYIKWLNIFSDIKIFLNDLNQTVNLSVINGVTLMKDKSSFDASMHSESLMFILKNEFGFDTLTVNGNFESNKFGFSKLTKHLAIGSLNALGFNLNFALLINFNIYLLMLKKLFRVGKNLETE